jgi:hypothetical protein
MARRTDLPQPLAFYADRYGVSEDSIKRWRKLGATESDRCPLEDPLALSQWWSRNMSYACPSSILAAGTPDLPPQQSKPAEPESPPPCDFDSLGLSPEEELDIAASALKAAALRLRYACAESPRSIAACQRELSSAQSTHSRVKAAVEKQRLAGGAYVSRAEVEQDITRLSQILADLDAASSRRIIESCLSLTAESRAEVEVALARDAELRASVLRNLTSPTPPLTLAA